MNVANIIKRARRGDALNIVFFGGSLTWGANASDPNVTSWRALTMRRLCELYPQARFSVKDSAIGGTGSTLGVFRLERDVFKYSPDLVLLDFTLNDNLDGSEDGINDIKNHSYERIIRECIARKVAVLPVFLTAKRHTAAEDISVFKRRLEHIQLFEKYQLEYADVLGVMNRKFLSGSLDLDALWPPELGDVTHPHDIGYAAYTEAFFEEWQRIENSAEKIPVLPADFISGTKYSNTLRVDLHNYDIPGWKTDYPRVVSDCYDWLSSRWLDKVIVQRISAGSAAVPLTFKVRAVRAAAMIETYPDSVSFSVSVNGGAPQPVKTRSVLRSQLHFVMLADNLNEDEESVITVIPDTPEKDSVLRFGALLLNSSKDITFEL